MNAPLFRALILVTLAIAGACAPRVRVSNVAPPSPDKFAELWQAPQDLASRDLFHGPGGADAKPAADAPFTWISTDATGYSPGYDVRGADGRSWSVKLGSEAQSEIVASRILWAIGYHQPATYYVSNWQLAGGPGGQQQPGRFRLESEEAEVIGDWSWAENEFLGTQQYQGLIVANILLSNWDWKTSNNKIYRHKSNTSPPQRYVVRDLGASLGKTTPSRLFWILPIQVRGFGQGSRNNIDDFESQGFIERVDENQVEFDFDSIYGSVVDLVHPSSVRWVSEWLNRVSDAQWDDAFRAAEYSPELRARFIRKIKSKIAEGLAVS
jgi:hypothetical protein